MLALRREGSLPVCALWRRRTGQSLGAKAVPSLPGKWPSDLGEIDPVTGIEILTVEEIATRLKVKTSWVYTHADELGAYKLGKYLRFSWDRVLERLPKLGRAPND